jgi:hypothetical protein
MAAYCSASSRPAETASSSAWSAEAGQGLCVWDEVPGDEANGRFALHAWERRWPRDPLAQRFFAAVGEAIEGPIVGAAGLFGGGQIPQSGQAFGFGVHVAPGGEPVRAAGAALRLDEVVRARTALTNQGEDHVGERREIT